MRKLLFSALLCIALSGCTIGTQLIGAYAYTPNPGTVVTLSNGISGIEIYAIDMPNVGEGYYQHMLNPSVEADGADYVFGERVEFTWGAGLLTERQEIASFTDGEGKEKHIFYDPAYPNALVDEDDIVYDWIKN